VRREKKSVSRSSPVSGYTISAVYQRGDRGCRHLDLTRSRSSLHSGVTTFSPISKGLSKVTALHSHPLNDRAHTTRDTSSVSKSVINAFSMR
jgi:hypothetical protein